MPTQKEFAVAFALTTGAGLATSLGAALVFAPRFYNNSVLSASLALAAGVMVYVSFVEIFFKGLDEFELHFDSRDGTDRSKISAEDYKPNPNAYHATTATFFLGILITFLLDQLVRFLHNRFVKDRSADPPPPPIATFNGGNSDYSEENSQQRQGESNEWMIRETEVTVNATSGKDSGTPEHPTVWLVEQNGLEPPKDSDKVDGNKTIKIAGTEIHNSKELMVMALITGTAIALHNFPEGLATFVASARDPDVGGAIAIAIAIHNIPEGVCVAVPIYFATKSKWKGFFWGTASGLAEPIAGAIGWAVLSTQGEDSDIDSVAYGLLFGLVSGMMVYISFHELLPTAYGYDTSNKFTTPFLVLGMLIMAGSLMLFQV